MFKLYVIIDNKCYIIKRICFNCLNFKIRMQDLSYEQTLVEIIKQNVYRLQ